MVHMRARASLLCLCPSLSPQATHSPLMTKQYCCKRAKIPPRKLEKQVGLGFAAGAMFWVACFELFSEAVEDSSVIKASVTTGVSFAVMLYAHSYFEHEA